MRPYLFYDTATSLCSRCLRRADGKVLIEEGRVYLQRRCPVHGSERVLLSDDAAYYRRGREDFLKPPEMPGCWQTPVHWGCPYDCGLCPDHEQHSCLTLIELTDHCNLRCPVCYAGSGPERPGFRTLAEIEAMLDAVVHSEGEPDVVQLSGGEPTLHPEFFAILDAARARPIRHLMVNTNGIRIATDPEFLERLASYRKGFEVYLQFDSLEREPLMRLRGADLRDVHERALAALGAADISTTLVMTVMKGVNDGEIGAVVEHALTHACVRGVTLQPVQHAGRTDGFDPARDRLTLSEVRRNLLEQTPLFRPEDVIPVPCHPDSLAMAYGIRGRGGASVGAPAGPPSAVAPDAASGAEGAQGGSSGSPFAGDTQPRLVPLTGLVPREVLLEGTRNTIVYEQDRALQREIFRLFATNHSPEGQAHALRDLLCCLPRVAVPGGLSYRDVFRVLIVQFLDVHSFDVRSVKKSCIHIAQPDGRLIPFDTFNLFYREPQQRARLEALRAEVDLSLRRCP